MMSNPSGEFRLWTELHGFLVRRRLGVLILATLLTGIAFSRFPDISQEGGPTAFLPQDIPEVTFWQDLNKRFGALNNLMIGLEEPSQPLTTDGLTRVANITNALGAMKKDGVLAARSVINVESTEVDEEGTMNVDNMVPSIPMNQAGLDALAEKIRDNIQVPGAFISRDLKAYVIMVKLDEGADSAKLADKIVRMVEKERGPLSAYYFGAAFATYQVSRRIIDGLRWVIPVFAAALFLVLFVGLRRPAAFLMTLLCAALPLVWWLGVLNTVGIPVTMPVLNGALLLLTFGALAFARVAEGRARGQTVFFSFRTMMTILVAGAAFAVVAAWVKHVNLSIPYLDGFSVAVAIGFLVLAVASPILVVPMMTLFEPAPANTAPVPERSPAPLTWRVAAVLLPVAITAASLWSMSGFRFAVSLEDMFSKHEDVGRGIDFFDRKLGGNEILQVSAKGDFNTSAAMNRLMRFTDLVEGSGQFADVRSITQIVSYVSSGMTGLYWIPPQDDQVADLYYFLEGVEDVKALVSADRSEAMLAIRMPAGSRGRTDELLAVVENARKLSAETGMNAARLRLNAISDKYEVRLPEGRLDSVLAAAGQPISEADRENVAVSMKKWIDSEDSPWNPAPEEWESVRKALFEPQDKLAEVIAVQPSYVAMNSPDEGGDASDPKALAGRIADSMEFKIRTATIDTRSASLAQMLSAGMQAPANYRVRAQGILATLFAPEPEGSQQVEFTLSGYPAFTKASEERLENGLKMSALVLFLTATAWLMLFASRNPARLVVLPVGAAAASATFAISGAIGLNADPNSATIYLIAPLAWIFLAECLNDESGSTSRYPTFFAFALAAGAASLIMFGVMPVARIGGALALSLAITVTMFAAFNRMWYRYRPSTTASEAR